MNFGKLDVTAIIEATQSVLYKIFSIPLNTFLALPRYVHISLGLLVILVGIFMAYWIIKNREAWRHYHPE